MSRQMLIAGNWKMNVLNSDGITLAKGLADKFKTSVNLPFEMLVCPPYTLINSVTDLLFDTHIQVGAQNCHTVEKGPHTGDISAAMLKDLGCTYVIIGHSDRRSMHNETDLEILSKAKMTNGAGMNTIICVGETESERNTKNTLNVVKAQILGCVPDDATAKNTVIAYEPVWAIGTGRTPTINEVQKVHASIRSLLAKKLGKDTANDIRILYGGSMNALNATEFLSLPDVDGGLIGGASLNVDDFWKIGQSCP